LLCAGANQIIISLASLSVRENATAIALALLNKGWSPQPGWHSGESRYLLALVISGFNHSIESARRQALRPSLDLP
jgi:hypothetical protein